MTATLPLSTKNQNRQIVSLNPKYEIWADNTLIGASQCPIQTNTIAANLAKTFPGLHITAFGVLVADAEDFNIYDTFLYPLN